MKIKIMKDNENKDHKDHKDLSSRRAPAQAVTSKWQLCTTSPMNNSSAGENGGSAKNGS